MKSEHCPRCGYYIEAEYDIWDNSYWTCYHCGLLSHQIITYSGTTTAVGMNSPECTSIAHGVVDGVYVISDEPFTAPTHIMDTCAMRPEFEYKSLIGESDGG